jgi:hypothetical protein
MLASTSFKITCDALNHFRGPKSLSSFNRAHFDGVSCRASTCFGRRYKPKLQRWRDRKEHI